jgi:hypothetical protein
VVERSHSWMNPFVASWCVGRRSQNTISLSFTSPVPSPPFALLGYSPVKRVMLTVPQSSPGSFAGAGAVVRLHH